MRRRVSEAEISVSEHIYEKNCIGKSGKYCFKSGAAKHDSNWRDANVAGGEYKMKIIL